MADFDFNHLSLENIRKTRERLGNLVMTTPSRRWEGLGIGKILGPETEVYVKLELFQHTGTFKARGALNNILSLSEEQKQRGVTACSAGNHAIAVSFAAKQAGVRAKVVMSKTANKLRIGLAQSYGADFVFVDSPLQLFPTCAELERTEGLTFIHPFDSVATLQGTATAGLEFTEQVPELDMLILPIGGGGLCGGFAAAVKQTWPRCKIYGVEPEGADTMHQSFEAGHACRIDKTTTIADSLAPPMATDTTYAVCRRYLERVVRVSDDELRDAMRLMWYGLKLAVEPACAAATAALVGPLREEARGRRVGVIACGANIDIDDFMRLVGQNP